MRGKHGDYGTIIDGIAFAREYDDYTISIGGGEPTMHPRFFDILRNCLEDFDYIWMATNGSQTDVMKRLQRIIDNCDYESFECECEANDPDSGYWDCNCDHPYIYQEDKLGVALSTDYFHDPIDAWVHDTWRRRADMKHGGFELQDVTINNDGIAGQGRAKKIGYNGSHCVCSDYIIKPDGKIRMCGCTRAPVIGDVRNGIEYDWQKKMEDSGGFEGTRCYKDL